MAHRILLADDDVALLEILKKELTDRGHLVLTAHNGQTAVHLAQKHKPDLIVLDVVMPMSTGLKAFEKLRTMNDTKEIPVIFLTSAPSADVYPTVAQGSRVAHLKKPIDIEDLVSLMQQFLK